MAKTVSKHGAHVLEPGEQFVAASGIEPPGLVARATAATRFNTTGVNHIGAEAILNRSERNQADKAEARGSETGLAEAVPNVAGILAVTDRRLLIFAMSKMSGRPKELLYETTRDQLGQAAYTPGKVLCKIELGFADGTAVAFEAGRAANLDDVAEALGAAVTK